MAARSGTSARASNAWTSRSRFARSHWPIADVIVPTISISAIRPIARSCARLSKRGLGHLYVDGGITIQRFLEAGLVQRMTITRVPVLVGDGIPLFGALPRDLRLEHIETRSYSSGLVTSEYAVLY